MEIVYFSFIVFLFMLAVFDLVVGVSNDAVNFLNSAIGAKVARFRTILIIASIGVFVGATMSNGMMDIARHGIFQPQMFSFNDLLCIFLAVMVTDVVLLTVILGPFGVFFTSRMYTLICSVGRNTSPFTCSASVRSASALPRSMLMFLPE